MTDGTPTGGTPPEKPDADGATPATDKPADEKSSTEAKPDVKPEAAASAETKADAPATETKADAPATEAKADAPATEAKADAPATETKSEAPAAEARPEAKPEAKPEDKPQEKKTGERKPAGKVQLQIVGRTDVGLVREHNEDSYLVVRLDDASRDSASLRRHELGLKGTLCVVCDGMGGAAAGEVASNMAVESLAATMLGTEIPAVPDGSSDDAKTSLARKLRMAAKEANTEIFREARANLARAGMGTTMTAVLFSGDHALIAQVGDSRAYVWRKGRFTQVTRDQSLVNQLLETGHITPEQAKFFEHSNVILQALGVQEEVEVQLSKVELRKGDRFIVCSDGLVGVVTDEEIAAVVGACDDLDEAARILIELANGAGGPDNISVITAEAGGEIPEATDADALEYQLWKIDPEPSLASAEEPITQPTLHGPEGVGAPAPAPRRTPSQERRLQPSRRPPRGNPTLELVSMAVVFGLLLGSVMTGAVIYKNGVSCHVASRQPGASVMADGRDTGIRLPTSPGDDGASRVRMRLRPGHHTVGLKGVGAAEVERQIDVARGASCEIDFTDAEAHAAAPLPVTAPSNTSEAE
jgi:protein phosphatase